MNVKQPRPPATCASYVAAGADLAAAAAASTALLDVALRNLAAAKANLPLPPAPPVAAAASPAAPLREAAALAASVRASAAAAMVSRAVPTSCDTSRVPHSYTFSRTATHSHTQPYTATHSHTQPHTYTHTQPHVYAPVEYPRLWTQSQQRGQLGWGTPPRMGCPCCVPTLAPPAAP